MTVKNGFPQSTTPPERDEDKDAVLAVRNGHKDQFEILVRKYMHRAHAIALVLVGDTHEAMDLSQEAFLKSFRAMNTFDVAQPFFPWFYRILKNTCLSFLKRNRKLRKISLSSKDEDEPDIEIADSTMNPSVLAVRTELTEKFWQAYGRLGVKDREIIALRHFEDMAYDEIAKTLKIPIGTVMSRLFHARRKLKERLEHYL